MNRLETVLRVPRTKIGVAGFYSFFYTRPRGRYRILFSDNITDRMLGNIPSWSASAKALWIGPAKVSEGRPGERGQDLLHGMCDQGPALLVNNRPLPAQRPRASTPSRNWFAMPFLWRTGRPSFCGRGQCPPG